jgi:hypothetical protein
MLETKQAACQPARNRTKQLLAPRTRDRRHSVDTTKFGTLRQILAA